MAAHRSSRTVPSKPRDILSFLFVFAEARPPPSSLLPSLSSLLMSTSNGNNEADASSAGVSTGNAKQESNEPVFAVPALPVRKSTAMGPPPPPLFPKEQRETSNVKENATGMPLFRADTVSIAVILSLALSLPFEYTIPRQVLTDQLEHSITYFVPDRFIRI